MDTAVGADGAAAPPQQLELGDVCELLPAGLPSSPANGCRTFALYVGRGHLMHAWSADRSDLRVRVDSMLALSSVGFVSTKITDEFDAFALRMLDAAPLPPAQVVRRALPARNSKVTSVDAPLAVILWARYGAIAVTVSRSLLRVLPTLLETVAADDRQLAAPITKAIKAVRRSAARYMRPSTPTLDDVASATAIDSLRSIVEGATVRIVDIRSLLASGVDCALSAWLEATFTAMQERVPAATKTYGMVLTRRRVTGAPVLVFSRPNKCFTILFEDDQHLVERLVRDQMECGVCYADLTETTIKVFSCSHFICGGCLAQLTSRLCPFCRAQIVGVREVTSLTRKLAIAAMVETRCEELAQHDVDAPDLLPGASPSSESPPSSIQELIAAISMWSTLRSVIYGSSHRTI